jgi:voltage-gated potassium channel
MRVKENMGRMPRLRRAFALAEDRYLLVLILIVVSLLVTALAANSTLGRLAVVVVLGGTLVQTLRTSGWQPRSVRRGMLTFVGLLVISGIVGVVTPAETETAFLLLVGMGLVLTAIVAIVRRLVQQPAITMKTVLGALCIYLYAGMLFALLYGVVDVWSADPFFTQTDKATSLDYVYFSIVTMTTVGYGDYTAAGDLGRMLAVSEALFGQLYLVSVVAMLVGNLGHVAPRKRLRDVDESNEAGAVAESDEGSGESGSGEGAGSPGDGVPRRDA